MWPLLGQKTWAAGPQSVVLLQPIGNSEHSVLGAEGETMGRGLGKGTLVSDLPTCQYQGDSKGLNPAGLWLQNSLANESIFI